MDNYRKNSVKLLPIIHNSNNKMIFYSEFDTFYDVGDIVYIFVDDSSSTVYKNIDSSYTLSGYKLLIKDGNKLTLDINYDTFKSNTNITDTLLVDCYLTRTYISKTSIINGGSINSSIINETVLQPSKKTSILWKQGIIINIGSEIKNINFESKTENDELLLKSSKNGDKIETYYSKNNNEYGLSVINTNTINKFNLTNCDINYGTYNNCYISIDDELNYNINGGYFNKCVICDDFIINGGYFKDCTFSGSKNNVVWNYGTWDSNDNSTGDTCTFKPIIWYDGILVNGGIGSNTKWYDGRFKNGVFSGNAWYNGVFDGGIFSGGTFENGIFNGGTIYSDINNGIINGGNLWYGTVYNSTINGGICLGNIMYNCVVNYTTCISIQWNDGLWYDGECNGSTWNSGTWYNGKMIDCAWNGGTWYDGTFIHGEFAGVWYDGIWYDGTFIHGEFAGVWYDGIWYDGIFDGIWENGTWYNGVFNDGTWVNGTWYNGIMNNPTSLLVMEWYDGIFNGVNSSTYGTPYFNWYGGSFNSGTFYGNWYDGIFYNGSIDNDSTWNGGIYYTINNIDSISPSVIPTNKKHVNIQFQPYKK